MIEKRTVFTVTNNDYEILDGEMIKTASLSLPSNFEFDPEFLYLKVRGVSSGEYYGDNKNQDYFPEAELKASYKTFLEAHAFKNHDNKDVAKAIGDVLDVEYNDKMKGVDLIIRIDRKLNPGIVRGFEKGYITDVSMGCRIKYSVCSICGKKAVTRRDYCEHIKYERGKVYPDGRKVFEINIGPKFHDISVVNRGAEHVAKAARIYNSNSTLSKTADEDFMNEFEKVAHVIEDKDIEMQRMQFEKVASIDMNCFDDTDEFENDIKGMRKELMGKIYSIANERYYNEKIAALEGNIDRIKANYTRYWSKEETMSIASKLKAIARGNGVPENQVLDMFLQVIDIADINISPLELHEISGFLFGEEIPNIRNLNTNIDISDVPNLINSAESASLGVNIPTLCQAREEYLSAPLNNNVSSDKIRYIIKINGNTIEDNSVNDALMEEVMNKVVKGLLVDRSMHPRFLEPRLNKIILKKFHSDVDPTTHYVPLLMMSGNVNDISLPLLISALMYNAHQNNRVKRVLGNEKEVGLMKFAGLIEGQTLDNSLNEFISFEKTASLQSKIPKVGYGKSIAIGMPATYAYSGYQRARIQEGKEVSTANRFIANNPFTAAVGQAMITPKAFKGAKSLAGVADKVIDKSKSGFNKVFTKNASINDTIDYNSDNTYNYNSIMKVAEDKTDSSMRKEYENKFGFLKAAAHLNHIGYYSKSNAMLKEAGLKEDDVNNYIDTYVNNMKEEISAQNTIVEKLAFIAENY